ncbi:universal stress protein [Kribbella monticola]|uniref:universal stress protein n=1 Tax=Kribbella monticola TaxID=2185285 RepID=UPI000DD33895|nr:universal stress protein [Kribbella monticola]
MSSQTAPVVVGYDGSQASSAAITWATTEAMREHTPLRIVEVFELVVVDRPSPGKVVPLAALRAVRERGLEALAESVRLRHPDLHVETLLLEGSPSPALIEETAQARMLVLGSRGLGGFTGMILGSVAVQVSAHAHCPVVVVPPDTLPTLHNRRRVVVGVDGSKLSAKAIDFAFEQAEAIGARVVAVHAWNSPFSTYENGRGELLFDNEQVRKASEVLVAEALSGPRADHPDIEVDIDLIPGQPARALLHAGEAADLMVVGSRGRGGFTGLLLGSTSQQVLHHARCPVAVVR